MLLRDIFAGGWKRADSGLLKLDMAVASNPAWSFNGMIADHVTS